MSQKNSEEIKSSADSNNLSSQIDKAMQKHSIVEHDDKINQDELFGFTRDNKHSKTDNEKHHEYVDSIMLDIQDNRNSSFNDISINVKKAIPIDDEVIDEGARHSKALRLFFVLSFFTLCFCIFMFATYAKILVKPPNMDPYNKKSREYPWSPKADVDIAMRGDIVSLDDYVLASSKKLYKIGLYVPSIYEDKRELAIKLLNIYGGFNKNLLRDVLKKGGNVTITDNASANDAGNLRVLNQKLSRLGVYKKCTFTYINKTSLQDSELRTLIAHAQITSEKGRASNRDKKILRILDDLDNGNIAEESALEQLNIALVEYKNSQIDLSKECYTPIFTYNKDVSDGANTRIDRGLDIAVNEIQRIYPFKQLMQPLLGFTNYGRKLIDGRVYDDKMKLIAQSGVEKYRDGILTSKRDGKIMGQADRSGNIIFNKDSQMINREDGFNIKLTIPLTLQSKMQDILEEANKRYKAQQIVAGIMDPHTGEILALASSASFNPNIGQRDKDITSKISVAAAERSFEPGSTIKPLVFSYLNQKGLINFKQSIDLNDGIYKLGTYTIRDSSPMKSATPEWIIIKSSNIGMTKLTRNLSGTEMQNLFKTFEVGSSTGIDIANEATGLLPSVNILKREVEKGTASYGYGLRMTFIQLLRSYAAFSNGGFLVSPHLTKYFISPDSKIYYPTLEAPKQIISTENAAYMQKLLHRVVKEGTSKRADVEGLIIGGKTGTAREEYSKNEIIYNGSFFGYASDGKKTYTIGVVTYGSRSSEDYYGGQTAAPVFAEVAHLLLKEGYLIRMSK